MAQVADDRDHFAALGIRAIVGRSRAYARPHHRSLRELGQGQLRHGRTEDSYREPKSAHSPYSCGIPAALMTFAQRAVSAPMNCANSCGLVGATVTTMS